MVGLWRMKYFFLGLVSLALGVFFWLGIVSIAELTSILHYGVSGLWFLYPLLLIVGGSVLFWAVLPVRGRARRKVRQTGRAT